MERKIFFLAVMLCLGFSQVGFSQATATVSGDIFDNKDEALEEISNENWSIYTDDENRVIYIDFENLNINLSDIVVKNEDGVIVMKDDVFDLPVNVIYELDFSEYSTGDYEIELRSFTGVIRKTISIK